MAYRFAPSKGGGKLTACIPQILVAIAAVNAFVITLTLIAVLAGSSSHHPSVTLPLQSPPSEDMPVAGGALESATIAYVVDGDTLAVVGLDGRESRVRLIGVDCPEAGTAEGEQATAFTKGVVLEGQAVWLEKDVSETDRYARLLRYVWLSDPSDPSSLADGSAMLNSLLVANGHASPKRFEPDTRYSDLFDSLEGGWS